jgi:hypothetical protein
MLETQKGDGQQVCKDVCCGWVLFKWLVTCILLLFIGRWIILTAHQTLQFISAQISSWVSLSAWNDWQHRFFVGSLFFFGFQKSALLLLPLFDLMFMQSCHSDILFTRSWIICSTLFPHKQYQTDHWSTASTISQSVISSPNCAIFASYVEDNF